ncbi:MAG: hypothetical protein FWF46_07525 [Oscillospiraceae bacterium]|nr:hypothetical protein [Oscillospiraceae bacterium]
MNELYELAEKKNIEIYENYPLKTCNGLTIQQDGVAAVALNKDIINSTEIKCVLAEELRPLFL